MIQQKYTPANVAAFWRHATKADGCWLWTGRTGWGGYGSMKFRRGAFGVHRFSWLLHRGPIPTGMCVCHTCDTPLCVNPDHLFLGTHLDNARDKVRKGRARGGRGEHVTRLHQQGVRA